MLLYDTLNDEKKNNNAISFDSIISLTSVKTSTSSIKPHHLEAKEAEEMCS